MEFLVAILKVGLVFLWSLKLLDRMKIAISVSLSQRKAVKSLGFFIFRVVVGVPK